MFKELLEMLASKARRDFKATLGFKEILESEHRVFRAYKALATKASKVMLAYKELKVNRVLLVLATRVQKVPRACPVEFKVSKVQKVLRAIEVSKA